MNQQTRGKNGASEGIFGDPDQMFDFSFAQYSKEP